MNSRATTAQLACRNLMIQSYRLVVDGHARRISQEPKRVNVDFPIWMVEELDKEAKRLGVTRWPSAPVTM